MPTTEKHLEAALEAASLPHNDASLLLMRAGITAYLRSVLEGADTRLRVTIKLLRDTPDLTHAVLMMAAKTVFWAYVEKGETPDAAIEAAVNGYLDGLNAAPAQPVEDR